MSDTTSPGEQTPLYQPFDPDDVYEFHGARLLLLLLICGKGRNNKVEGRTKLAKLDFFLRYPQFLERALLNVAGSAEGLSAPTEAWAGEVEAPMVRYRYGPWDHRYRDFLAFLEGRELVRVVGSRIEGYTLTKRGRAVARQLAEMHEFVAIRARAEVLAGSLANWSGTQLKELIYDEFDREVGQAPYQARIQ